MRVLAAGALPLIATTLLLTYSRAGVAAAILGVAVYVIAAHPRGLMSALLAAGPATALALSTAYDATLLSSDTPASAAAVAQGHEVGRVVIVCVAAALVLRAALLLADARLDRIRLPARARRPVRGGAWVAVIVAVAIVGIAFDAPGEARARYEQFVEVSSPNRDVTRERLVNASNAGRLALWRAAFDGFEENRLLGTGAGTYGELWIQYRSINTFSSNAHGLYQEVLAELGIVGLALLLVALVPILVGLAPFRRGPDRCVYAALFAAALVTAGHGAFDWDWEMPATQLWLFALGGLALARASDSLPRPRPGAARGITLARDRTRRARRRRPLGGGPRVADSPRRERGARTTTTTAGRRWPRRDPPRGRLPSRSEPREMVGVCLAQAGRNNEAATALQRALDRDPRNWGLHYSLAAVLAASDRDPRPHLREARRAEPRAGARRRRGRAARRPQTSHSQALGTRDRGSPAAEWALVSSMGTNDSFERLYEDHAADLLGYLVYRTGGDVTLAEDILADTFERVLTARRSFVRREASERTWLYTIAMNRLRDLARRSGAEARALEHVHALGRGGPRRRSGTRDRRAARSHPPSAPAVARRRAEKRSRCATAPTSRWREMAQVKGVRQTTMEGRVYRGLRRLRDELG